jgi:lysophospholipid acyltransferase (LPLAT)-like uncharacterized protein
MPDSPDPQTPRNTLYEQQTRSGRRLTPLRRLLYRMALPVGMLLIRFWWLTCRVVRVVGEEHVAAALADGPVVPVFWHQHQLFCTRFLMRQRARGLVAGFLISPSVDGELPAMIARREGAVVLRGSSSSSGARVLRDNFMALRQGVSPAITPDGPYGPRFEFKPGAILAAQLSGRPMLPLAFHASRAWRFRTWDRFVLPWPFARVAIAVGAPRYVPKGLDAAGLERWQADMAAELHAAYRAAREALASA